MGAQKILLNDTLHLCLWLQLITILSLPKCDVVFHLMSSLPFLPEQILVVVGKPCVLCCCCPLCMPNEQLQKSWEGGSLTNVRLLFIYCFLN